MPITLPTHRAPTHPGEMLLREFVEPLGLTQTELAQRLGISYPRLNEIIHGKRAVTPDTALRLERLFGMDASFWLTLQHHYDLWQARRGPLSREIARIRPILRRKARARATPS